MTEDEDKLSEASSLGRLCWTALLFGVAIASLSPLLLNVPVLELAAALFLFPGGLITSFVSSSRLTPHPLLLIAANAVFYAVCTLALCLLLRRRFSSGGVLMRVTWLGATAVVLFVLACIPRFDPLWPYGMRELQDKETKLRSAIHTGLTMDEARAAMAQESVPLYEKTESEGEVLRYQDAMIVASAGDRLLFGKLRTDAVQYPCRYDLQVAVLFAPDGALKDRYVGRVPVCP